MKIWIYYKTVEISTPKPYKFLLFIKSRADRTIPYFVNSNLSPKTIELRVTITTVTVGAGGDFHILYFIQYLLICWNDYLPPFFWEKSGGQFVGLVPERKAYNLLTLYTKLDYPEYQKQMYSVYKCCHWVCLSFFEKSYCYCCSSS